MKLRNKENRLTGKLTCIDFNIDESEKEIDLTILLDNSGGECIDRQFYSLDELKKFLRDWEEIKEPLIKDVKIRKAVRAWAEANNIKSVYIVGLGKLRDERKGIDIEFNGEPFVGWVTALKTIPELCGEEED